MQQTQLCVGIILDGNRRWAKKRGLPTLDGHRRGMDNIEPIVLAASELGVANLIVYAFSTENWNRSQEEVSYLLQLFETGIKDKLANFAKQNVLVRFVGQRERFSKSLQDLMCETEANVPTDIAITLWVCLSYGGRAEIATAASFLQERGTLITEESLASSLWTAGMPDPDIIIRTGGEQRLSNFLLWQSAYSELFFSNIFWPDFTRADLKMILDEYATRKRRMGA